jgi:hypothetical protein
MAFNKWERLRAKRPETERPLAWLDRPTAVPPRSTPTTRAARNGTILALVLWLTVILASYMLGGFWAAILGAIGGLLLFALPAGAEERRD